MSIAWLEQTMYQLSDFFLAPVLILLMVLFAYSLYSLGQFSMQALQRRQHKGDQKLIAEHGLEAEVSGSFKGYPLLLAARQDQTLSNDEMDVLALSELEGVRTVSRLAPMLGLIATMVPMGPALKSLANGNVQGISDNLIVAFSAVIFGLVIASITFWIASVKKRWLATELVLIGRLKTEKKPMLRLEEALDEAA